MSRHRESSVDTPPTAKRQRVLDTEGSKTGSSRTNTDDHVPKLFSLERSISPPLGRRNSKAPMHTYPQMIGSIRPEAPLKVQNDNAKFIPSPFHLTRIRDLPDSSNVDTIRLTDILGDPMIRECWQFNYMFDIDFLM
jgi:tyrosyl-DNA phosphodiesterase-1